MSNSSLQDEMKSNAVDERIRRNNKKNDEERKRRKRHRVVRMLVIIALILVIGGVFVNQYVIRPLKQRVAQELAVTAVEQALENAGVSDDVKDKAEQIIDSMSAEDQSKVEEIVNNHATPSTIAEATKIYRSQGTSGLKSYAEKTLSDSEISELQSLYDKYKGTVLDQ